MSAATVLIQSTKPAPSFVTVTPELADRWLKANGGNRKLRASRVNQYARDMKAGRWRLSNDAICFGVDGRLLNGQHRLSACVKAAVAFTSLIIRNLPDESMSTMDSGVARTAADALGFSGESNAAYLAAGARLVILVETGRIYLTAHQQGVSHAEIQDFITANPSIRHSVDLISSLRKNIDATPTSLIAAHFLIARKVGPFAAAEFFALMAKPVNQGSDSPILALNSRLRNIRKNKVRVAPRDYLYLIFKAWNYFADGKTVTVLTASPRSDVKLPTIHPDVR